MLLTDILFAFEITFVIVTHLTFSLRTFKFQKKFIIYFTHVCENVKLQTFMNINK